MRGASYFYFFMGGTPPATLLAYANVSGTWKQGTYYANVSGTWKQITPSVNVSGTWES